MNILFGIIIFLEILEYIIILDVILSWLMLFGINFRPKFIHDILNPLYKGIKKIFPTTIGAIEFVPIVAIFLILFIKSAFFIVFPELQSFVISIIQ